MTHRSRCAGTAIELSGIPLQAAEMRPIWIIRSGMPGHDSSAETELLEAFLQDDDLDRLEDIAEELNIFEVLGAVRQELRHSSFLAWLLDPSRNHGLGDYFLKRFLWTTAGVARERDIQTISPIEVNTLDLDDVTVRREWRNIDILISSESQRFVCAIENKVESSEHGDQLCRYLTTCKTEFPEYRHHFVFLTPWRTEPSCDEWVPVGYDTVAHLVERVIDAKQGTMGDEVGLFLRHYASMLRRHIVGESEIDKLCTRIYNKHRQALEMLFERRPDRQSDIKALLQRLIKSDPDFELDDSTKTYIRFAPRSWTSDHLKTGTGWTKSGRILLFQFDNGPDSLRLGLYMGPGDPDVRSRIWETVRSQSGGIFSGSTSLQKWCTIFQFELLSSQDYQQDDLESIEAKIQERMTSFKATQFPQIDKIIRAIEF